MSRRFGRFLRLIPLLAMAVALPARGDESTTAGLIDRQIAARLEREGLRAAPLADDAEWIRRLHLDLHGVVPSAERVVRFLESTEPDKRARLIDELVESPRYGEFFGDVWRNRLLSPIEQPQRARSDRFAAWLAERLNTVSWSTTVEELLTASGTVDQNPATLWLIEGRNPVSVTGLTDLTSRYFLGFRLNCIQCHDHPFAEWKQQDYWGMAAFFAQIQTPGRSKLVHVAGVQDNLQLTLESLKTADAIDGFQSRSPMFPGGAASVPEANVPLRREFARWLVAAENPYFARATVNRMWWHFFGRGLVHPVDDMHSGHPASYPELLESLSRTFVESGYDLKALCRSILGSQAYQRTSRSDPDSKGDVALFGRMSVKTLSAEQLYDSLVAVVGPPSKAREIDARLGTRYEFCRFFGGDGDPEPTRYDRGIPHLLRMMNSPQFAGRNVAAVVDEVGKGGRSPDAITESLFLRILSRRATPTEKEWVRDEIRECGSAEAAYHNLVWALLMSGEFSLNH